MNLNNRDSYHFCALWSLLGAAILSAIFSLIGLKSWYLVFPILLMGSVIGGVSAAVAWKCCDTPHWGKVSLVMTLSCMVVGAFMFFVCEFIHNGMRGFDLFCISDLLVTLLMFGYGFVLMVLPSMFIIFLVNFFLLRKRGR